MNEITHEPQSTPAAGGIIPSVVDEKETLSYLQKEVKVLDEAYTLASKICQTTIVPKQYQNRPMDASVAIMWGASLGLGCMASLQNIAVINGMPTLWGDALVALVRKSDLCEYIVCEYDDEKNISTVKTKRRGQPEEVARYSLADAERAGLTSKDSYKNHPKRMLQARARSHLLRDVYPDLIKGFQVYEVIKEDSETYNHDAPPAQETKSETLRELSQQKESEINIEEYIYGCETREEFQQAKDMVRDMDDGKEKERLKAVWLQLTKEKAEELNDEQRAK